MKCFAAISCFLVLTFAGSASAQQQRGEERMPLSTPKLSAQELSLWQDADFQRRFTESYIAETDIEPTVTKDEREAMLKVLEFLGKTPPETDKAMAQLEKYRGGSAVFDFTIGNIYFQSEQFDQAATAYESATKKHGKFRRAWRNLALIRIRQENYPEALKSLRTVIELGGGDGITFGLLGYAYSNVENHLSAESAYRMANMLEPEVKDWKMGLVSSFFRQQRYSEVVALTKQMLESEPENEVLWLLQANAYIGLNQPMQAAENYEVVDRLGKSSADSLNMLGDIYINEDLYDLAVDNYIRAMELDTQAKPTRALRAAKVLTARGAPEETKRIVAAIDALHGKQLAEDERKEMLKLRARIAAAEEATDEEAAILEQIVAIDPLDGEALILLGQHSARADDKEKAIFYYERAASIPKTEADAKVRHAQLLVQSGDYAAALPLLRSAQQIRPRESVQQFLDAIERAAAKSTSSR